MSEGPGGPSPFTGHWYLHAALAAPFLGAAEIAGLDAAVGAEDGWWPVASPAGGPVLTREWRRGADRRPEVLRLVVLGWYPLLVTVGGDDRPGPATRRVLRRVRLAVQAAGGTVVPDEDLPDRIAAAPERWHHAAGVLRRADRLRGALQVRGCARCGGESAAVATHCQHCGARFGDADDADRDAAHRRALADLTACRAELDRLTAGDPLPEHTDEAGEPGGEA